MNENLSSPEAPSCDQCELAGDHFCEPRAQKVVDFIEKLCTHSVGTYSGKPLVLEDWQRDDIIRPLFGQVQWSDEYGQWVRQYRIAWLEMARKNGKSMLMAAIGLYMLCGDGEQGAQVFSCAATRRQASMVFEVAEQMVNNSTFLKQHLEIKKHAKRIVYAKNHSFWEVIAADAQKILGANASAVLFDEIVSQPDDRLWTSMKTSFGSRTQPLLFASTTASNNPHSFCAAEHNLSERVIEDPALDPARFAYIRNVPMDADPWDESLWHLANPALGSFLSWDVMRQEAREAQLSPSKELGFRQFRLNQYVTQESRWILLATWDEAAGDVNEADLERQDCWGGLDLSSTTDMSALALCFPQKDGTYKLVWRCWIPEEQIPELDSRTAGAASVWLRDGKLITTPGNVVDYSYIFHAVSELADRYRIRDIGYDRWNSSHLVQQLMDSGMTMVQFGQGYASMSPAVKEFERLILEQKLHHGGHPVARWAASNVVLEMDAAGNVKFSKNKSHERIDPLVAAAMAVDRALRMAKTRRGVGAAGF